MEVKGNNGILYKGRGSGQVGIFDNEGIGVMKGVSGIGLGGYISRW